VIKGSIAVSSESLTWKDDAIIVNLRLFANLRCA
jgi:hypothetical protein